MDKVLVTGSAGFIGSNLARLLSLKFEVIGIDNFQTGSMHYAEDEDYKNLKFQRIDMTDSDELFSLFCQNDFRYVFHYAATVGVEYTLKYPLKVLADIQAARNLLQFCIAHKVERVFFPSSSEVYGDLTGSTQSEDSTPLNSKLPYAVVKGVIECMLRTYNDEYGLAYTIFRVFNTFGPRQSENFVMSRFIHNALVNEPLILYGDGRQTRTFNYVGNHIRAVRQAIDMDITINETINLGGDEELSMQELAHMIIARLKSKSVITYEPARSRGDMQRRCPDISKLKTFLPEVFATNKYVDLETGIKLTADFIEAEK